MSRVRNRDTSPELVVRRLLWHEGFRYRLHAADLPGSPDIVFRGKKKAVFVHGCFWHRHPDPECSLTRTPKTRIEFWKQKFEENRQRDLRNQAKLRELGWRFIIVWECELGDLREVRDSLIAFLSDTEEP